ncbi:MAG: MFS transporter [Pseudomonadota bacterium]
MVTEEPSRFAALRTPAFRRFWFGSLASVGAVQLLIMGQAWLVYRLSGSPLDLGYLGASASLPAIVVSLFGGVIADRFDKRRILLATSILCGLLLALLTILDVTNTVRVWHVLLIVGLISAVSGFDWPVRQAIYPQLVPRTVMTSAVMLNSFLWQATRMFVPAIGGVMIAAWGTWTIFGMGAVGFFVMGATMFTIRLGPAPPVDPSAQSLIVGIRFMMRHRVFWVLILLSYALMFLGTSYLNLMPLFVEWLGSGERAYGLLISTAGIGSVIGTLAMGRAQHSPHLGRYMVIGLLGTVAALGAFYVSLRFLSTSDYGLAVCLLCAATMATFSAIYLVTSMTTLQLVVPDALRGRVMSVHGITFSLIPLGALLGGAIAEQIDAPSALALHTGLLFGCVLWVMIRQSWLWSLNGNDLGQAEFAKGLGAPASSSNS